MTKARVHVRVSSVWRFLYYSATDPLPRSFGGPVQPYDITIRIGPEVAEQPFDALADFAKSIADVSSRLIRARMRSER